VGDAPSDEVEDHARLTVLGPLDGERPRPLHVHVGAVLAHVLSDMPRFAGHMIAESSTEIVCELVTADGTTALTGLANVDELLVGVDTAQW